jgi:hypothetical protein
MLVDVVFLKQGSTVPLRFDGHQFAWREGEDDRVDTEAWKQSALKLAHQASAGEFAAVEVFLCLKAQQLADLLDRYFLRNLVQTACNHSWGANVYVVVDTSLEPLSNLIELQDVIDSLCDWFEDMHKFGATDIIQVAVNTSENVKVWEDAASLNSLRSGADRSRKRHEALLPEGNWKGILRKEAKVLRSFLEPFDIRYDSNIPRAHRGNWVTIIEDSSQATQKKLIDKAQIALPDKHLVAAVTPSDEIRQLGREGHHGIARYRGSFELRYLFYLLGGDRQSLAIRQVGRTEPIAVQEPAFFGALQMAGSPSLLLTGSFPPASDGDDEWHIVQAAIEIGQSTIRKPAHAAYVVSPAADCDTLPDVIKNLPLNLTAWLHVGHGDKDDGLQEASGKYRPVQRWLDCFNGHAARGGNLALAIFSTCQSEEVARGFARAGVGVAIGFVEPVDGDVCRFLTAPIISAALRSGGDRETILRAFHAGCADLQARGASDPKPVAFWAEDKG